MIGTADTLLEIALRGLRVAAAVFMLVFMAGDLAFPQHFCEELVIYSTDGSRMAVAGSGALTQARLSVATYQSDVEFRTADIDPLGIDGDMCLHLLNPRVFAVAEPELKRDPARLATTYLAPSPDPTGLYHPPRSL